jgi:uncharacterized membrane protein YeiB
VTERLPVQLYVMLLGPIGFACPFLLGLVAGRRRMLERPVEHRRFLRAVAVVGIPVSVLGAQPLALTLASYAGPLVPDDYSFALALHDASGVLGGAGYAAAIALLATRLPAPPGRVVDALAATGQRSMTCYLAQSVVWAIVFTPFLLGMADDLSVTGTALLATCTWLGTVLMADALARAGRRGPFEVLLRRVTYGPSAAPRRSSA